MILGWETFCIYVLTGCYYRHGWDWVLVIFFLISIVFSIQFWLLVAYLNASNELIECLNKQIEYNNKLSERYKDEDTGT